jgi:site-specific DNA-cytosine methylase
VFILENVPGFLKEFPRFSKVVEAELKGEYKLECKRLVAQFYGTPQFRDRVIVQGVRRDLSRHVLWPEPTSEEFYEYTRSFDTAISMTEALQDLGPAIPYSSSAPFSDHMYVPLNSSEEAIAVHVPNGGSLRSFPDRYLPEPYKGRKREPRGGWPWYYRKPRPELPARGVIASIRPNYATILAPDVENKKTKIGWVWNPINPSDHTTKSGYYTSPVPPRRLTVRECARLQTFPDWFRFTGTPLQQHRQIGNAVPVEFARRLCEAAAKLILNGDSVATPVGQLELF